MLLDLNVTGQSSSYLNMKKSFSLIYLSMLLKTIVPRLEYASNLELPRNAVFNGL